MTCTAGWHVAGTNTSLELALPPVGASVVSIRALVRVVSASGRTAQAVSGELAIDGWQPTVGRVLVDGFARDEGPPCILNRTEEIGVSWESADEGSGILRYLVTVESLEVDNPTSVSSSWELDDGEQYTGPSYDGVAVAFAAGASNQTLYET